MSKVVEASNLHDRGSRFKSLVGDREMTLTITVESSDEDHQEIEKIEKPELMIAVWVEEPTNKKKYNLFITGVNSKTYPQDKFTLGLVQ